MLVIDARHGRSSRSLLSLKQGASWGFVEPLSKILTLARYDILGLAVPDPKILSDALKRPLGIGMAAPACTLGNS
jgi:hypothetical protein